MSEYRFLFSPLKIGTVVVPNRINFAAHMTNLAVVQKISDDHISYYRARAKGGCGLITTEEMTVHPSDHAYEKLVDAFKPEVIPGYQKLTKAIRAYDTLIFAQLNHNGMQADGTIARLPVWGPSPGKDPLFREICKEKKIEAGPGDFAENITTSGIELVSLPIGTRLQVGEAIIKIKRIGKEKHLIHTYNYKGVSILPERGAFAKQLLNFFQPLGSHTFGLANRRHNRA